MQSLQSDYEPEDIIVFDDDETPAQDPIAWDPFEFAETEFQKLGITSDDSPIVGELSD
jgi:hypothetical protein